MNAGLPALERFFTLLAPHYKELRRRLGATLVMIVVASIAAYLFIEPIAQLCVRPLFVASPHIRALVYTNLPEAFITYLKLALLIGLGVSYPFALYQFWAFISPGLHRHERSLALLVALVGSLLFAAGASFAFFIALPRLLTYLLSYAQPNLEPLPKFALYLTFVARAIITFGLAFQIPFLQVMAARFGLVERDYFRRHRLKFWLALAVLAFMLTSGDLMATLLLTLPLAMLYETGVFLCGLWTKKKG
ncbi:MAG: twin-arginine translocase subunit TatC [Desulfobulbaceae bacterium]|jgi:sec-independent protein translocase protein TatC|nr:twin-arginine translocase subunit TatC [Desulfobulbaceae bacterium]